MCLARCIRKDRDEDEFDDYDFRTSTRKENLELELELRFAALIYLDVALGVGRFYRRDCLCDLCDLLCK